MFMPNKEIIEISSTANQKIKDIAKLVKDSQKRKGAKIIIVDGKREIEEALNSSWQIKEFYYCESFIKNDSDLDKFFSSAKLVYKLEEKVFEKISYKKNPDGYLAIFEEKYLNLSSIKLKENPLVLILESVEKPGNLGGIIRTAYASGVDLIILNDQKTDIYSPNVIRSSTGFIFSMPLVLLSVAKTISWLEKNNFNIFVTTLEGSKSHFDLDFRKSSAIVFGTESFGISDKWKSDKLENVRIPMVSGVDSLNVSVSVGIMVYEALRQRKFFN